MPEPTKLSRSLSLPLITLYGLGTIVGGGFYALVGKVAAKTHTPIRATVVMTLAVLGFALWLPLVALARLTSGIILVVFALVNLSLVLVKLRRTPTEDDVPRRPLWVPLLGFVVCAAFLGFQIFTAP
jgi:APA family basic amino acid/polyamine antiporter